MLGVYHFLATTHVVTLLIMFILVSIVPIQLMRKLFEGSQYDVAWSANLGGVALALVMLDAVLLLHQGLLLPSWMGYGFQVIAWIVSFVLGSVWLLFDFHTQWADRYHHIVVFPLQVFLLTILLPVIFGRGTNEDRGTTSLLLVIFACLLVVDVVFGNLDQRQKLRETLGAKFLND
jgi:hypothetical protein